MARNRTAHRPAVARGCLSSTEPPDPRNTGRSSRRRNRGAGRRKIAQWPAQPLQGLMILSDLAEISDRQGTDDAGPQVGAMERNTPMESFSFVFHSVRVPGRNEIPCEAFH